MFPSQIANHKSRMYDGSRLRTAGLCVIAVVLVLVSGPHAQGTAPASPLTLVTRDEAHCQQILAAVKERGYRVERLG